MTRCGTDGCRVDHDMYRLHPNGQPWLASPPSRTSPLKVAGWVIAAVLLVIGAGLGLAILFVQ